MIAHLGICIKNQRLLDQNWSVITGWIQYLINAGMQLYKLSWLAIYFTAYNLKPNLPENSSHHLLRCLLLLKMKPFEYTPTMAL